VVWQEGGPGGQMVNDFGASVEAPYSLLPNFGIPVMIANAAGRSVKTPRFYAAANPQCSLVDLMEEFHFGYVPFVSYLMGRSPTAEAAEYLRDSPMYGAKDIRTPTLLFHGTDDFLPLPLINNIHDQLEASDDLVMLILPNDENPTHFVYYACQGDGIIEFQQPWTDCSRNCPPTTVQCNPPGCTNVLKTAFPACSTSCFIGGSCDPTAPILGWTGVSVEMHNTGSSPMTVLYSARFRERCRYTRYGWWTAIIPASSHYNSPIHYAPIYQTNDGLVKVDAYVIDGNHLDFQYHYFNSFKYCCPDMGGSPGTCTAVCLSLIHI
jgi:hypothetical protein